MNLYQIEQQISDILSQVNEDGMLTDEAMDELEQLQMDEKTKLENIACFIKDLQGDAQKIRNEEIALAERRKANENKSVRLKDYLSGYLISKGIRKFDTPRAVLSFRKSEQVIVQDEESVEMAAKEHPEIMKIKTELSKTEVKKLLKSGVEISGIWLQECENIQIK